MKISSFIKEGGASEFHVCADFADFNIGELIDMLLKRGVPPVFGRFFVRDYETMAPVLERELPEPFCGFSIIGQPPLDGSDIAVWLYYSEAGASHNGYSHYWNVYRPISGEDETCRILGDYSAFLEERRCSLAENCIRTWFFVDDIDRNYAPFVANRRKYFDSAGLTKETHYIASTGINGTSGSAVAMDAYAVGGLDNGQVRFLRGSSHLSSTISYGVTFERGTLVQYGDRKHIYISGTASIDSKGDVLFVGDAQAQTKRLFENIEVLLSEGGASLGDMVMMIVYLRERTDYHAVSEYIGKRFPSVPAVMVEAPVCRPDWLVEVECIAVVPEGNSSYRSY